MNNNPHNIQLDQTVYVVLNKTPLQEKREVIKESVTMLDTSVFKAGVYEFDIKTLICTKDATIFSCFSEEEVDRYFEIKDWQEFIRESLPVMDLFQLRRIGEVIQDTHERPDGYYPKYKLSVSTDASIQYSNQ